MQTPSTSDTFNGVGFSAHDPDVWHPTAPSFGVRRTAWRSRFAATGFIVAADRNGDRVQNFESRPERFAGEAFVTDPDIARVVEQPLRASYSECGRRKHHTFDFLTVGVDGTRTLVAVKHSSRLVSSRIHDVVSYVASQNTRAIGDRIVVMTERDFSAAERFNAELIHEVRREPVLAHDAAMRAVVADIMGSVAIEALSASAGLSPSEGFRTAVRLIGAGRLRLSDKNHRIDHSTPVTARQ